MSKRHRQLAASEEHAQGPYVAARARFEPATLRTGVISSFTGVNSVSTYSFSTLVLRVILCQQVRIDYFSVAYVPCSAEIDSKILHNTKSFNGIQFVEGV